MTPLLLVQLGDSHVSPNDRAASTVSRSEALGAAVERIGTLSPAPQFVIHTGDICGGEALGDQGSEAAYEAVEERLSRLPCPFYAARGNHDDARFLDRALTLGPRTPLRGAAEKLAYSFEISGHLGIVLDSCDGTSPAGHLGDEQLRSLAACLEESGMPVLIFLHHPPVLTGSEWVDRTLRVRDGDAFHTALCRHARRVRAVLFGHVHAPVMVTMDGLLYCSCAGTAAAFDIQPGAEFSVRESAAPTMNAVLVHDRGVQIFPISLREAGPESP